MDEEIDLFKGGSKRRTSFISTLTRDFKRGGVFDKIHHVGRLTYESRSKEVQFVERDNRDALYYKWVALRDAGVPVVPSMRMTDRDTVMMTDLRADGSELYGKGLAFQIRRINSGHVGEPRGPHKLDSRFLEIVASEDELKKIEMKAKEYAQKATDAKIALAEDDPFELVIRPNGEWDIVCLDIQNVTLRAIDPDQNNLMCVDTFLTVLTDKVTQNYLKSIR